MDAVPGPDFAPLAAAPSRFARRLAIGAFTMALLAGGISLCGRTLGHTVALAGYTDKTVSYEIVVGNDVLAVPANLIRQSRARRDGAASRLDLYLRWPEMDGFSEAARADFNNAGGTKRILFLTFEPRTMSRDMSGRYEPIYRALTDAQGEPGPAGVGFHGFAADSGYVGEKLAVATRPGEAPFVARCLDGAGAAASLAPCERDIQIGGNLSLTYRFPQELLAVWPELEAAVRRKAKSLLERAD